METLKLWLVKLIGKKLDDDLAKWGISKTKLIVWIGLIVMEAPKIGAALGHPFIVPSAVMEVLTALGLVALRDGMDGAVSAAKPPVV